MAASANTAVFLLAILCTGIFYLLLKLFHKLCWNPLRIQRLMRSQGIYGPPFKFIYGNMTEIINMKMESMRRSLDISDNHILPRVHPHIHLWIEKYGKNFLQWNGHVAQLIVSDAETVKEILHNREEAIPKIELGRDARRIFGNGFSTSEGEKWAKFRRIADFAFHGELLKNMVPTMVSCAEAMLEKWKKNHDHEGKELDLFEEFKLLTSDIIAHTAFGSSYLEGKVIFESLSKLSMKLFKSLFKRRILGISMLLGSKDMREGEELERRIQDSIISVIKRREEKVISGEADNYGNDFLGLLLKAKNEADPRQRISVDDIVDECKTIYFAGQETTGVLLAWTSFLLATHVHWQEEARKEVFNIFGNSNPTSEGIGKLKTLSMIVKECLRLYPPAPSIPRMVKREVKLGKLILPTNLELKISTIAVHHDTAVWGEDAHVFKPERFSEEAAKDIPSAAYLPFGLGPRNCVGNALAVNETKIVMAMILQRFSFTISPAYVHAPFQFLTICPQHGVQVKLRSLSDEG